MTKKKKVKGSALRDKVASRKLLILAVEEVLAQKGFAGLGVNAVARYAGVDKVLIYRYFGGMQGLIHAFGQESDFWPTIQEMACIPIVASGISYLACPSRKIRPYNGIDLKSEEGWQRIEAAMRQIVTGVAGLR